MKNSCQDYRSHYKMTARDKLRAKRLELKVKLQNVVILLFAGYLIYAGIHYNSGYSSGCNNHSILVTLFPIRQIYLIPRFEREWSISTARSIGESKTGAVILGIALANEIRDPIMDVVRYGDCADMIRMTGGAAELRARQRQRSQIDAPAEVTRAIAPRVLTANASIRNTRVAKTATKAAQLSADATPTISRYTVKVTSTVNLNIRSGPGTGYNRVGMLRKGEQAIASSRNDTGEWIQLENGWVSAEYIATSGDINILPVSLN